MPCIYKTRQFIYFISAQRCNIFLLLSFFFSRHSRHDYVLPIVRLSDIGDGVTLDEAALANLKLGHPLNVVSAFFFFCEEGVQVSGQTNECKTTTNNNKQTNKQTNNQKNKHKQKTKKKTNNNSPNPNASILGRTSSRQRHSTVCVRKIGSTLISRSSHCSSIMRELDSRSLCTRLYFLMPY